MFLFMWSRTIADSIGWVGCAGDCWGVFMWDLKQGGWKLRAVWQRREEKSRGKVLMGRRRMVCQCRVKWSCAEGKKKQQRMRGRMEGRVDWLICLPPRNAAGAILIKVQSFIYHRYCWLEPFWGADTKHHQNNQTAKLSPLSHQRQNQIAWTSAFISVVPSLLYKCWVFTYISLYLGLQLRVWSLELTVSCAFVSQPVSSSVALSQLKAFSTSSIIWLHPFGDLKLSTAF